MASLPRTCVRVHRRALAANYQCIREAVGPDVAVLAVVKADAYGHGAVEVVRTLASAGADQFAVASLDEGVELRQAGIAGDVVLLSGIEPGEETEASSRRLTPLIHRSRQLHAWEQEAVRVQRPLPYHLSINTGMNRLGLDVRSPEELASLLSEIRHLRLEGISTHLASAEDFTHGHASEQRQQLLSLVQGLAGAGLRPRYLHLSNSAAIAFRPEMDADMVRPGLALYGYLSSPRGTAPPPRYQVAPVLEWKARILTVRQVPAGARVGYDGNYRADRPMCVGVLSAGYGDGLDRRLSNAGEVLAGQRRCPIIGLVSMDLTTIDLTAVPEAREGQEVTLIGDGLGADSVAQRCQTVPYEILCRISKRVPRIYCD